MALAFASMPKPELRYLTPLRTDDTRNGGAVSSIYARANYVRLLFLSLFSQCAGRRQRFVEPIFQVHYLDLVRNPVNTVAALYSALRACARSRRR
jgi:hypothetical protein